MQWLLSLFIVFLLSIPSLAGIAIGQMSTALFVVMGAVWIAVSFGAAVIVQGVWRLLVRKERAKGTFHRSVNWTALVFGLAIYAFNILGPSGEPALYIAG